MGGVVTFDYSQWIARYPEFGPTGLNVSQATASLYFQEASLYLDNTGCSRVWNLVNRALYLNMIVAHIAKLYAIGADGLPLNPLVGRISDGSEGTVSVRAELESQGASAAFWTQTTYGFSYWSATQRYRSAVYRSPWQGPRAARPAWPPY